MMGSWHRWGVSSKDLTLFILLTDPGRRGHPSPPTPSPGQRGTQMAVVYSETMVVSLMISPPNLGGELFTRPGEWG